jgi:hypothetical protein
MHAETHYSLLLEHLCLNKGAGLSGVLPPNSLVPLLHQVVVRSLL